MCLSACSSGGDDPIEPTPKPEVSKSEITIDSNIISNGLSFSDAENKQTISFSTNENWTLSVAATTSGGTWCTPSITSGTKGNVSVKFTVAENTSYDNRSVSVTIKAGTASKTFTISQKGIDALLVTTDKYEVNQEGGTIEIEVKSNISYKMEISESAKDWIKESSSRALTAYKHKLDIAMNEDYEKREGEITFKSGDKSETVKVYQAGGAILLLSQNEYNVSDKGDTISVDIKSNIEFGVQMPNVDWVVDEASSRGMSSHTLKYIVKSNETYDSRSAEIIFYDKNSDLKDTVKVIQSRKEVTSLHVAEPGTLKDLINESDKNKIFNLKISGNINGTDIKFLREMLGRDYKDLPTEGSLEILDLQDANIVKGGESYYENFYSSDNQIGDYFVSECNSLKHIILPSNIVTIGGKAFSKCENLESIILPSSITLIDSRAFEYCSSLKSIELPNSLKEIGIYCFSHCSNLTTVIFPENLDKISMGAFSYCDKLREIILPQKITTINENAFSVCQNLETVVLPESLVKIDEYAFYACFNLKTINIPENLKEINKGAFSSCESLISIDLPKSISTINEDLFSCCFKLKSIKFYGDITTIKKNAFVRCESIEEFSIPENVEIINEWSFGNCKSLKTIVIPKNVERILEHAFSGCREMENIRIYNSQPPIVANNSFEYIDVDKCKIHIPKGSLANYKKADYWKDFSNIIEME